MVAAALKPSSRRWKFAFEPTESGSYVTESMRVLPRGLPGLRLVADCDPASAPSMLERRIKDLGQGMLETLKRIKAHLERVAGS